MLKHLIWSVVPLALLTAFCPAPGAEVSGERAIAKTRGERLLRPGRLESNRWVKVHETNVGGRAWSTIVYCPQAGGMLYAGDPNAWNIKTELYTMGVFPSGQARWEDYRPQQPESLEALPETAFRGWNYTWGPLRYGLAPDGRKVPLSDPAPGKPGSITAAAAGGSESARPFTRPPAERWPPPLTRVPGW